MKNKLKSIIIRVVEELYKIEIDPELTRPEVQFGDFSTNIALRLAKQLERSPREIGQEIADKITLDDKEYISKVELAGPGFINIYLNDKALIEACSEDLNMSLKGKVVVAEFSDANPFKILHAGHLYTSIVGDVIANILEVAGAKVHRVNFGGDVGLHVAKNMWAILNNLGGELPEKLQEIEKSGRSEWLSKCYVEGSKAYEENETYKQEIIVINKRLFEVVTSDDHDSPLAKIYWECRSWSYDYFNAFYNKIGVKFEKYYPESEVMGLGLKIVKENIPEVYQESNGAVVFDGEKYGLYTNVFINSLGLPTYAAKDVGLIFQKWEDYHFDISFIITADEIKDYMRVVQKSIELIKPELTRSSVHLTHGIVKLSGGVKMSSRLGNFLRAIDILDASDKALTERTGKSNPEVSIGAIKYSFLKQRIGGDIIYEPEESVSTEGNSGPYLQYAHARACRIIGKAPNFVFNGLDSNTVLDVEERALAGKISGYNEAIELAINEYKPHHICTYLYELAQVFNRFYEKSRVIGDDRINIRLNLVKMYAEKLKLGLSILGIDAPESM